jgi:hypothetical protein
MSFALFLFGLVLLVGEIAWGLSTMGLAPVYIGIACLIVLGLGIMSPCRARGRRTTVAMSD